MADIPVNKLLSGAEVTITKLDLSAGPHTFTFIDHQQKLIVENNEASDITVNVSGDGVTTVNCPGVGVIDASAGFFFSIPASESLSLYTSSIRAYLGNSNNPVVVTVTGATGSSVAWIEE